MILIILTLFYAFLSIASFCLFGGAEESCRFALIMAALCYVASLLEEIRRKLIDDEAPCAK